MSGPLSAEDLAAKIEAGERLTEDDARGLESGRDVVTLGMLADTARRERHGNTTTFLRVADYPVAAAARPAQIPGTPGEVRIVGKPASVAEAVDAVAVVRGLAGSRPVSAFSLADLEALPESLADVLSALTNAGLELIAEAPLDVMKAPERALEATLSAGVSVARLTVQQTGTDTWAICSRAVALQERFKSFRVFAPLARMTTQGQPSTGYEDVKRVALARLLVDNVVSIQVDWSMYGPKLAQVALTFGADDLDGVLAVDDESSGHRRSPLEEIRRSIHAAWLTPVERNARFELL